MGTRLPMIWVVLVFANCAQEGGLNQANFTPECGPSDLTCLVEGINAPIAKGASFSISVNMDLQGSSTPSLTLESSNEEIFTVSDKNVLGQGIGVAALMVLVQGETVADFMHLWVNEATEIVLHRWTKDGQNLGELTGNVQLLVGEEVIVSPLPFADSQSLNGTAETEWESEGDIISILDEGVPGRKRLVAREVGTTTAKVKMLGLENEMEVEVLP